jgi:hypothetical protein
MGYVYRELIPDFEVGDIDDIENWLTIDEYKALPEDEKKSYAYYEWNNHWDDYDYKRNIVSKISFLSNLFSSGDSVEDNFGWIDVEDSLNVSKHLQGSVRSPFWKGDEKHT